MLPNEEYYYKLDMESNVDNNLEANIGCACESNKRLHFFSYYNVLPSDLPSD